MAELNVLSDAAVDANQDLLNFERYIDPLVSFLTNPNAETPFTIGIFGQWGSGKSSLLKMLDQRLEKDYSDKFVRVHFNPWVHRSEDNMLVPLLHTLNDTLMDDETRFAEAAKKVGRVLLALGTDVVLRKITADVLSLDKLSTLKEELQKESGEVKSEIRKLRTTLQGITNLVKEKGARTVLFIDDLDRCQPDQIIDLLEAVKLFFDLRHTFIILAVDKEVIDRGIQVKYSKFKFAERESVIGAEYLEKMVQLPLRLFPLHENQVGAFIKCLNPSSLVLNQLALLQVIALPNPRKIKRILNILNVTSAIMEATPGLEDLNPDQVARLVVLQVQSSELYQEILEMPDLLVALESVYTGKRQIGIVQDFQAFGRLRDVIQKTCQKYYQPDSYLLALFEGSAFEEEKAKLPLYLTMLGG